MRGSALALTMMAAMAPFASAAADPAAHPRHGHSQAPAGTDEQGAGDVGETRADRDLVLAATWHLDPELLVPQATDSPGTAAAREELGRINARLPEVVSAYDAARARSVGASLEAEVATKELRKASAVAARAKARWEADRALLVSYVTEAYTTDSTGALGILVSVRNEQDLFTAEMMLREVSNTQSTAVQDAARSRERLQAAVGRLSTARARAQDRVAAAEVALATATAARDRVLGKLLTARRVLKESVLADQLAAIKARKLARAAAALSAAVAVSPGRVVAGAAGHVSFPLPAGASFVDQGNWGAASAHWAKVHTGDDLSTACGTPVLAATDGTIIVRTDQSWSGRWLVLVSTGDGQLATWYAHMQALLVTDGESVRAGQQIGVVGDEGNATGCHLHFEVHPYGGSIYEDDTDPQAWLRVVGVYPG